MLNKPKPNKVSTSNEMVNANTSFYLYTPKL